MDSTLQPRVLAAMEALILEPVFAPVAGAAGPFGQMVFGDVLQRALGAVVEHGNG